MHVDPAHADVFGAWPVVDHERDRDRGAVCHLGGGPHRGARFVEPGRGASRRRRHPADAPRRTSRRLRRRIPRSSRSGRPAAASRPGSRAASCLPRSSIPAPCGSIPHWIRPLRTQDVVSVLTPTPNDSGGAMKPPVAGSWSVCSRSSASFRSESLVRTPAAQKAATTEPVMSVSAVALGEAFQLQPPSGSCFVRR